MYVVFYIGKRILQKTHEYVLYGGRIVLYKTEMKIVRSHNSLLIPEREGVTIMRRQSSFVTRLN